MLSKDSWLFLGNLSKVSFFCSYPFFILYLKAFHLKAQSGLLIKSMAFIYDNPIQAGTVYPHGEHKRH